MLPQLISRFAADYLRLFSLIISHLDASQVVFIPNENNAIDEMKIVASRIPTWRATLSNETLRLNRSSALFVWAKDPWTSLEIERRKMRQLKKMSMDTLRSRFLILQSSGDESEATLRLAWDEHLLDVTIVDPREIHHYNPFADEFSHLPHDPSTILFPDKLANLHKHELKVGILNYPPYSAVSFENGRYRYKLVYGELLKSLSSTANFSVKPDVARMAEYGVLKTDGTATGLIGKVMRGELDLVAFGAFLFWSPFGSTADRTTYIDIDAGCPVVPVIPVTTAIALASSTLYSIAAFVGMVLLVYLSSRAMRLNRRLWHPLHVIFLILGVGVSNSPRRLRDRFLYGSIMMVSLFYSSNIFAQLTSVTINSAGNKPFESFQELDDSGLVPMLHPNVFNITFLADDEYLKRLGKKARVRADFADICPRRLMTDQSVCCIFERLLARVQVETNQAAMKMGKPCFWTVTRSFILPRASPFTPRFDRIIRMVQESGLETPWFTKAFYETKKMKNATATAEEDDGMLDRAEVEQMLKDNTITSTRIYVVAGYVAATCVFIGEVLHFRVRKWRARAKVFDYVD